MKKILIIAVVFLSLQSFAQKTVTIYNLSNTNFDIGNFGTRSTAAGGYPIFSSNYGTAPNTIIHIPAGTTYILQCSPASTTRFPFLSPTSSPQITSWFRRLTATGAMTALSSTIVSSTYGNTQIFDYAKTQVGPNGSLGGGTLSLPINVYHDQYSFGTSGIVTVDQDPLGTPGGTQNTTIIVTN